MLTVGIKKAMQRLKSRKIKNRYDKFSKSFYINVQKAFIKIAKKQKKRYFIVDNSDDSPDVEKFIIDKVMNLFKK